MGEKELEATRGGEKRKWEWKWAMEVKNSTSQVTEAFEVNLDENLLLGHITLLAAVVTATSHSRGVAVIARHFSNLYLD